MALSDYLTSDEWDACYYAFLGKAAARNLGTSMHKTIDALLATGYRFAGLDEHGNKSHYIPCGNGEKLCMFLGNPHGIDPLTVLDNGRNFLKQHLPDWVDETDEEWSAQMKAAREQQPTPTPTR
jgi:hypothetical protein